MKIKRRGFRPWGQIQYLLCQRWNHMCFTKLYNFGIIFWNKFKIVIQYSFGSWHNKILVCKYNHQLVQGLFQFKMSLKQNIEIG